MKYGIINYGQLEEIARILKRGLIDIGVACAILVDRAGNSISKVDNGQITFDSYTFATLAAGNYASVEAMAQLVGETEFTMLFHKGENASIYFSGVNEDMLLVAAFGREISLGFLRLKVADSIEKIKSICIGNTNTDQ